MEKQIGNFAKLVLACCVLVPAMGCLRMHFSTPAESDGSLARFERAAESNPTEALRQLLLQTASTAREGNLELTRAVLLTRDFQSAFLRAAHKSGLDRTSAEQQLSAYYMLVTVTVLPEKIKNKEVASLLCEYYYGKDSRNDIPYSELTAKSLVVQVLEGPHISSVVSDRINGFVVENVENTVSDGVPATTARVTERKDSSFYLWFVEFRQYEVDGKKRWIPVVMSPAGFR